MSNRFKCPGPARTLSKLLIAIAFLLLAGTHDSVPAQTNAPTLTSLGPNSAPAGGPAFTLTVAGANFNRLTIVRWNGADQPTMFISTNQLAADIPASKIAWPGRAKITAFDQRSGNASNVLSFTISQPPSPAPRVNSIVPDSAQAGGPAFTSARF
jgi:IPT/TIG domain